LVLVALVSALLGLVGELGALEAVLEAPGVEAALDVL